MAETVDRAEPFTARLHFITRPVSRLNAARIRMARGYYMRSPGWVVLTTIGRRSGLPRQVLLPCGRRGNEIVVVSTYGLRSDWIKNLSKNPQVKVSRDGAEVSGTAELIEEVERKQQIISDNPFVMPPFAVVRAIALGPMRAVTTALFRRWVITRSVVVIRT
jgi:deazaflavin-dependent oxidoreductase (nitroreductase family)